MLYFHHMAKSVRLHIFILLLVITLIFLWVNDDYLSNYSLQLTAILLLSLIVAKRILDGEKFKLTESIITTVGVILTVSASGNISSPLFFLNYFLLFALSLLLEPVIPLVLSIILIIFYLFTSQIGTSYFQLLELLAFPFMTPLAYFTGKIFQKEENQKQEIKNLQDKVEELEEELVENETKP